MIVFESGYLWPQISRKLYIVQTQKQLYFRMSKELILFLFCQNLINFWQKPKALTFIFLVEKLKLFRFSIMIYWSIVLRIELSYRKSKGFYQKPESICFQTKWKGYSLKKSKLIVFRFKNETFGNDLFIYNKLFLKVLFSFLRNSTKKLKSNLFWVDSMQMVYGISLTINLSKTFHI